MVYGIWYLVPRHRYVNIQQMPIFDDDACALKSCWPIRVSKIYGIFNAWSICGPDGGRVTAELGSCRGELLLV